MKRSEMIEVIAKRLNPIGVSTPTCEEILDLVEEAGMLPPVNICKVIPDATRGGYKHSPTAREWDDEDSVSQD